MPAARFAQIRRHPFIAACALIGVLALAAGGWVNHVAQAYEVQLDEVTTRGTAILNLVSTRSVLEGELDLVRLAVRRTEDNLVVADNLAENLWYFYSVEGRTGSRLTELRQLNSPAPPENARYRRIPYDLEAVGDFSQVTEFLRQLESGPRLMRINAFSLRREPGNEKLLSLDLSVDLLGRL